MKWNPATRSCKTSLFVRTVPSLMLGAALIGLLSIGPERTSRHRLQAESTVKNEKPFGLQKRVAWTRSRITGSLEPSSPYKSEPVFRNLQFLNPVVLTRAPGVERLFVAELAGRIFSFTNDPLVKKADLFLDMKKQVSGFRQVYGLTFHPEFSQNGYCFICYVGEDGLSDGTRVSRFQVRKTDPPTIDPASESIIFQWRSGGHNGGCLKFGPDGYLYISTGDGAGAFPPDSLGSGQDISNVLSSVLRIDVDRPTGTQAYGIPENNPFLDTAGARGEIWAYGFRNPWKLTVDSVTGEVWVGDVGWELWEMIHRVQSGGNYGWSLMEGPQAVHPERLRGPTPILAPAAAHSHTESRSITGGHVYRGTRLKELQGNYIYGDYVTGKVWALDVDSKNGGKPRELVDSALQIICFGRNNQEELFLVDYGGTIHRLIPEQQQGVNTEFPVKLSQTGLFESVKDQLLSPGVLPYSIKAQPWADGAIANRYLALPGMSSLGVHPEDDVWMGDIKGQWSFPNDAVIAKTLSIEMVVGDPKSLTPIETQILHRNGDTWRGYSYAWNNDSSDANLVPAEGMDQKLVIRDESFPEPLRAQTWHFSSRTECIICHTTRGGSIYGLVADQLDRDHDYGEITDNQLRTLSHIGVLTLAEDRVKHPIVSPYDEKEPLDQRARAYLHVNCAHCHRRGGGGTAAMDIRREYKLKQTHLLEARPTQGAFGIHGAQVVVPGDPYRSILFYRMAKLGRGRMPYFGSSEVDTRGLSLIHDWIEQLTISGDEVNSTVSGESQQVENRQALSELNRQTSDSISDGKSLIEQLLSSTSGALMLLHALDGRSEDAPWSQNAVAAGLSHDGPEIRDLFERFLPEEQRSRRLGNVVDPNEILVLQGNMERGKTLFFNTEGVSCKNCHQIDGRGAKVGPDLSDIGKKLNKSQLLTSMLQPSKDIDPKFVTYLIETTQGRVHTGLLQHRTSDKVILRTADNKEIEILADQIELMVPEQISLMPELLLRDLTARDVADLLAYLGNRKLLEKR